MLPVLPRRGGRVLYKALVSSCIIFVSFTTIIIINNSNITSHIETIMPSVNYYNQSGPFWDFIANMEEQGFGNRNNDNNTEQPNPWAHPWAQQGWGAGFPFGGPAFAHRGRHGPPGPQPPAPEQETTPATGENEKEGEAGPSEPRGPPPPFSEHAHPHGGPHAHRGRCGGRGRGGWGGRGRGGPRHAGGFPYGGMGGFGALAQMFQDQLFDDNGDNKDKEAEDFKPEADVFDTAEAFVIHVSLPGAKKEDVGVSWDAEKSELSVAGVVYRPGDEEFLKTLAMDERRVGAFERKVRLGSRANPAQVDVEGITARMEDGVLRVEVPKLDGGYVEIRKVDIE